MCWVSEECPYRPDCPGCPRFGLKHWGTEVEQQLQALSDRVWDGRPLRRRSARALGFRHRARLAVRGTPERPRIGLFRARSHDVVDAPSCPVHHPHINLVAQAFRQKVIQLKTPVYCDNSRTGLLRYLQLVVERSSGGVQVVAVTNSSSPEPALCLLQSFVEDQELPIHSVFWNGQPESGNYILGPHWKRIAGPEATTERLGGVDVFFPPDAFGQANLQLFDQVVSTIHSWLDERGPGGRQVLELYAGAGAIGLGLVAKGYQLTFNEIGSGSLAGLGMGLRALGRDAPIIEGTAAHAVDAVATADTVVVDPPRKGLERAVLDQLVRTPVRELIYLSCGLPALCREAEQLIEAGYRVKDCLVWEMFPFTEHVETLIRFVRDP